MKMDEDDQNTSLTPGESAEARGGPPFHLQHYRQVDVGGWEWAGQWKKQRVGEFGCWGASSKSGPVSSGQKRSALCWAAAKPDKQAHHSAARLVLTLLVSKQSVRRQEHPSQIPCTAGSDRETPTQVTPPTMQQHESRGCHILWEVWNTSLKMGKTKIFYPQWFIGFLNYIVSKPDNFSLC